MNKIETTKLNSFEIRKQTDKNGKEYFIIINSDNRDEAYFCFKSLIREGWDLLTKDPSPTNIEIEYEENEQGGKVYKRVIALYSDNDNDIFV